MILSIETIPLIILAFLWIIGAILQDLKRREVDNIWNFSLIAFALAYRLAISIHLNNYAFFINSIFGFLIFIILGNLFYYSRVFAGGDAKLLIALGTILPLSYNWTINLKIFTAFILFFLIGGAIYVLIWAIFLTIINFTNFKKELKKQIKSYKKIFYTFITISITLTLILLIFQQYILITIPITIILFPILLIFAKTVEESSMIKSTPPNKVTLGDWLYKDIKVNNKTIKANWEGINEKQLQLIKKHYKKKYFNKTRNPLHTRIFNWLDFTFDLYLIY